MIRTTLTDILDWLYRNLWSTELSHTLPRKPTGKTEGNCSEDDSTQQTFEWIETKKHIDWHPPPPKKKGRDPKETISHQHQSYWAGRHVRWDWKCPELHIRQSQFELVQSYVLYVKSKISLWRFGTVLLSLDNNSCRSYLHQGVSAERKSENYDFPPYLPVCSWDIRDSANIWGLPIWTTNYTYRFDIVFAPGHHLESI